jgi:hypothetical protein
MLRRTNDARLRLRRKIALGFVLDDRLRRRSSVYAWPAADMSFQTDTTLSVIPNLRTPTNLQEYSRAFCDCFFDLSNSASRRAHFGPSTQPCKSLCEQTEHTPSTYRYLPRTMLCADNRLSTRSPTSNASLMPKPASLPPRSDSSTLVSNSPTQRP